MDYEIVLEDVGKFGNSQKVLGLIIGYVAVFTAMIEMCPVFINYTPDFRLMFSFLLEFILLLKFSKDIFIVKCLHEIIRRVFSFHKL